MAMEASRREADALDAESSSCECNPTALNSLLPMSICAVVPIVLVGKCERRVCKDSPCRNEPDTPLSRRAASVENDAMSTSSASTAGPPTPDADSASLSRCALDWLKDDRNGAVSKVAAGRSKYSAIRPASPPPSECPVNEISEGSKFFATP